MTLLNNNSISKFGFPETIENQLALMIISKFTKNNKSRKINYRFIDKEISKYNSKHKNESITSFTPFVVAEIIESGSVYSVFDD